MLANIPVELRLLPQWVIADMSPHPETGLPKKIPLNPRTGFAADVNDPNTWGTFEECLRTGYHHIGFVLTRNDPYCIIDLDNKPHNPATPDQLARHQKILDSFVSYTERSTSGHGYHIIVKGSLPSGVHRDNVEVYSSGRYMIMTGNVVRQAPIVDYQAWVDLLYAEMQPATVAELVQIDGELSDAEIVDMASNAVNGEKFNALCAGNMEGYPSQSEADFALLSIIAFYTQDNEQVRRIFRMTALGKRDKAIKNNKYLDFALGKIRGQQAPELSHEEVEANVARLLASMEPKIPEVGTLSPLSLNVNHPPVVPQPIPEAADKIELPPGLIGEIAEYFYATAIRPVPEVALAASIALMAGIVGRSYNVSGTGLNQYIILLAKTGSGKEGALSGMENLLASIRPQIPVVTNFMGPAAFASGQALVKILDGKPCFVSVLGEFGLTLQQLSDHRANSAQIMLRKVLLDLYAKSGWNRTLQASVYSDSEKNTNAIQAPNVTILGESTPETFFDGLDASHIAEGLIPRFMVIEYKGDRPPRNRNANCPPSEELAKRFCDVVATALNTTNNNTCAPVQIDQDGLATLDAFDLHADQIMNASKLDVEMQLWNRAHLKALKLAALVAVGCNPWQPTVTKQIADWSVAFVRRDIESVVSRFQSGDVGEGDGKQVKDLTTIVRAYFTTPEKTLEKYGCPSKLIAAKIIPHSYLIRKTASVASFRKDKQGSTAALKRSIQTLIEWGALVQVAPQKLATQYSYSGLAYMIGGNFID